MPIRGDTPSRTLTGRFVGARDRLGVALAVSLVLHLGVAAGWVTWWGGAGTSGGPSLEAGPAPEDTRLGLSEAETVTVAWLGYVEPTPHQARRSIVEQSEAVLAAGSRAGGGVPGGGDAGEAVRAPAESMPDARRDSPEEGGAEGGASAAEEAAAPALRMREVAEWAAPAVEDLGRRLAAMREAMEAAARAMGESAARREAVREAAPAPDAGGRRGPPEEGTVAGETERAEAGVPSDRESAATSLEDPIEVEPGQVAVAQGLEIKTRRPRWTSRTLVVTSPRNPTVELAFGREGRVRRAEFVVEGGRRLDTGYKSVDEPLLSAMYMWRASGARLRELPADDPEATLTIRMRVKLR